MKILSIQLKNYRQYRAEDSPKKIEFSPDDNKNFTIIQGPNGSGKTNLLNAINWCLYATEPHLSRVTKERSIGPFNTAALQALGNDKSLEMSVRIDLGDSKPQYHITRSVRAYKGSDDDVIFTPVEEGLKIMYLEGRDWKDHQQPSYLINHLLPEGVSGFFLFDGEQLDDFFKEENREGVRKALLDVSQISLINSALSRLDNVKDEMRRRAKGLNSQADIILGQIEAYKKSLKDLQGNMNELTGQKTETVKKISDIDEQLKQVPREGVKNLQNERERLTEEVDDLEDERKSNEQKMVDLLVGVGPGIYVQTAIRKTLAEIEKRYKTGELPPNIREPYLKELLRTGKCICGTDISKPGHPRENVEKHLQLALFSHIDEEITTGKYELPNIEKTTKTFTSETDRLGKLIRKSEGNIKKKQERLKEISTLLMKFDQDKIQQLEGNRRTLEETRDDLLDKIGGLKIQVETGKSLIGSRESDYNKEIKKSEKYAVLQGQMNLCEKAIDTLESIKRELMDETRKVIETKTKEYFLNLIWKKDTFVDVKIDENYSVFVIHKGGWDALGTLSAGERQVLALSFMAALKEVSGFDAPVVIDTPLGRISKDPKDNIASCLPKYLAGTQVTLLVTDQEYTDSVRSRLVKRVGREWQLAYDEQSEETEIIPYGT